MPRLNSLGNALMGVGGVVGNVSVDGVVPASLATATAGSWRWLTSGIIAGQADTGSGFGLYQVTLPNTLAQLETPLTTASEFGAGNSVWAAWNTAGVRTSVANFGPFPNFGVADVDFEGRFGFSQNRAEGRGLITYDSTGTRLASWDVQIAFPVIRMRDGVIAYSTTGGLWLLKDIDTGTSLPIANQEASVSAMVPVLVGTTVYVLEQTDTNISIRPATSGTGYVIALAPAFNSDVILLSPGVLRIAWSTTSGEGPTRLRMMDLNLNTGANTLWTTASGSLVSSTGTPVSAQTMPVGPIQSGDGSSAILPIARNPVVDTDRTATPVWWKFFERLAKQAGGTIDASRITGLLQPEQGGTGTGTGTNTLIAENLIGTVPQASKWTQYDTSATGAQNNFYINAADVLRCSNASTLTLTGVIAGVNAQRLVIIATNADVVLVHQSASSTAANRFETFDNANLTITTDQAAYCIYDGTDDRWRALFVSTADPSLLGFWAPLCAGDAYYTPDLVLNAGTWSNVTNGDPVTPEVVFDSNGDVVMSWTPGTGPYLAPIVVSEDSTIAVWTPTP